MVSLIYSFMHQRNQYFELQEFFCNLVHYIDGNFNGKLFKLENQVFIHFLDSYLIETLPFLFQILHSCIFVLNFLQVSRLRQIKILLYLFRLQLNFFRLLQFFLRLFCFFLRRGLMDNGLWSLLSNALCEHFFHFLLLYGNLVIFLVNFINWCLLFIMFIILLIIVIEILAQVLRSIINATETFTISTSSTLLFRRLLFCIHFIEYFGLRLLLIQITKGLVQYVIIVIVVSDSQFIMTLFFLIRLFLRFLIFSTMLNGRKYINVLLTVLSEIVRLPHNNHLLLNLLFLLWI